MDFGEAFKLLRQGGHLRRAHWSYHIEIQSRPGRCESFPPNRFELTEFIMELHPDGCVQRWIISDDDLLASDWSECD